MDFRFVLAVLVASLALFLPSAARAAEPGLVGQWHLDSFSGTGINASTPDSSGFGNTGTFAGTPTFAAGRFGQAFAGPASAEPMSAADAASLRPAGAVSVTTWVKQNGYPGFLRYIAAKGDFRYVPNGTDCAGSSYAIYTGYSGASGLTFYTTDSGGGHTARLADTTGVFDNHWHAVTGTFDGRTARLYVDGALKASSATTAPSTIRYGGTLQQHGELGVGAYPDKNTCPDNSKFPGAIDEVRVHNRALSAAEITKLHAASATTPPDLTPPGGPTGPPPPGPSAKPAAALSVSRPSSKLATNAAVLNAGGSRNSSRFLWDIGNNGTIDAIRPTSEPLLGIRMPSAVTLPVKLTAIGADGARSSTIQNVAFQGPKVPKSTLSAIGATPILVTGANAGIDPFVETPSIICFDQTVTFGLTDAQGCFREADNYDDVPDREREVVRSHYESPIFVRTVTAICNRAKKGEIPQSDCDHAREFFGVHEGDAPKIDVYYARGAVKLNGLKITPRNGATVVVYPAQERVISSDATVKWGSFKVKSGQIDMNLKSNVHTTGKARNPNVLPEGKASLLYFNPKDTFKSVGNFPVNGWIEVSVQVRNGVRASVGSLHLEVPPILTVFGGKPPTADVELAASNPGGGPDLDNMALRVPEANLGPVRLSDMSFVFKRAGHIDNDFNPGTSCDRKEWKIRGNVQLTGPNGGAVYMTPPPPQNGLGFCAGEFKHFGANIDLPQPRPQIFPGVFLDSLNFGVQLDPVVVRGGGGFSAGEIAKVYGELLIANGTPQQPYTMGPGEPARFNALRGRTFTHPTVAVGGDVKMHVPGTDAYLPMGDAAIMYSFPNYMYAGGSTSFVGPGMRFFGNASVSANLRTRQFDALVGGHACIAGITRIGPVKISPCIGGYGRVSSRGIMACLQISEGEIEAGAGYHWGALLPEIWPLSCYPSRYWLTVSEARASAAKTLTFRVAKGETLKQLRVRGTGAAPKISVQGPDGTTVTSREDGIDHKGPIAAIHQELTKAVWIGVKNGKPGTYRITTLPGSVPLQSLAGTRKGYDSKWKARVTGRGRSRVLHYDARKRGGGQVVRFYEVGQDLRHLIVTSHGGTGIKRFTPASGSRAVRRIVAEATIEDRPIPSRTLARFRPPASSRISRPQRVTLRRKGTAIVVTWKGVKGAQRYGVKLKSLNQKSRTVTVGARRRSLRIKHVPVTWAGTVSVSARDVLGTWGRTRSASFKRRKAPFTVIQTKTHNEKLTAKKAAAKKKR